MPRTDVIKGFEPDCREAVDSLRGALIELYASVGADPAVPQDAARRFGVNKTLTWNVSRVMGSTDPIAVLPNIPGASALKGLLKAIQKEGASSDAVARVQRAAEALDQMVERHIGDRTMVEMVVDGMGRGRDDHLEISRKLAFRGNSGLWGVQARTRVMTAFVAPNADDPDRIDMAIVRGYVGLRRLRPGVRWPIFQIRGWGAEGDPVAQTRWKSLDSDEANGALPVLRRFSTIDAQDIHEAKTSNGYDCILAPGPIGNVGAIDVFAGDFERAAAGKYATEQDRTGEFGATISAPTERLILDLIAHEDLEFALSPKIFAYSGLFMQRSESESADSLLPIPVPQTVVPLPGSPPVVVNSHVPKYPEIVSFVYERMGWNAKQFRGCRYELSYPPLGSTVLVRFDLPTAPGSSALLSSAEAATV